MASPNVPAAQVLPVTDPLKVEEAYATEVIVNIRDSVAHVTFILTRPIAIDANGKTTDERIVTARVVMSVSAATAFAQCFEQVRAAAAFQQTQKQVQKLN